MGNTAGKQTDLNTSLHNLSGRGNLSEREASSAWYRFGVSVTDVYDVVEVLGQGHMGEVFTVRRKTTGHHTELTRVHQNESKDDLALMLKDEQEKQDRRASSSSPKPKGLSLSAPPSPGGRPSSFGGKGKSRKPSVRGAIHKTNKVLKKAVKNDKNVPKIDEDADSNLAPFIKHDSDEPDFESQHSPRHNDSTPRKSVLRTNAETRFGSSGMLSEKDIETEGEDGLSGSLPNPNDSGLSSGSFVRKSTLDGTPTEIKKGVHFQRTFAVKTILTSRINKDQLDELVNEIMIMRKLDHPYVLKLYEVYHVKRKLWLVTELLSGGDLSSRKLNEHDAKSVIEQVLRALVYLHRMNIVHRDIKLENVLYENHSKQATVRLIDFGLSRTFDRTSVAADYARTPYTMSPETAASKNQECAMTDKTDVWAVGVIAFIMLSGEFPFIRSNEDLKDPAQMDRLKRVSYCR